jgi:hypothetical protein
VVDPSVERHQPEPLPLDVFGLRPKHDQVCDGETGPKRGPCAGPLAGPCRAPNRSLTPHRTTQCSTSCRTSAGGSWRVPSVRPSWQTERRAGFRRKPANVCALDLSVRRAGPGRHDLVSGAAVPAMEAPHRPACVGAPPAVAGEGLRPCRWSRGLFDGLGLVGQVVPPVEAPPVELDELVVGPAGPVAYPSSPVESRTRMNTSAPVVSAGRAKADAAHRGGRCPLAPPPPVGRDW